MIAYVNNTVVRRNDVVEVERLKKHLHSKFDIKDLRELRWFLGIEIDAKKIYTTEGNSKEQNLQTSRIMVLVQKVERYSMISNLIKDWLGNCYPRL